MADVMSSVLDAVSSKHHIEPHPGKIFEHVSHFGHNVLWITFIIFILTFVIFAVKTFQIKPSERATAYTSLFIVGIATMSYYSMATGLGVTYRSVPGHLHHYRQLFYARYIDWAFTTPLLLLELVLLSGLDLGSTIWIVGADVAMIVTGLFGSFESGRPKWGWFLAGCVFMLVVMVGLLKNGSNAAYRRNEQLGKLYTTLTGSLLVLWWVYPIVWAVSEGKAKVTSDIEVLAYAILDVLAKVVWSTIIFINQSKVAAGSSSSHLDAPLMGDVADEDIA